MASLRKLSLVAGACTVGAWGVSAGATLAQDAPAGTQFGAQLEEVVVTAQRREERLQDVPISVTALSTAQLERKHINDIMSLNTAVPNFSAKPTFTPMEMTATIRGITQLIPAVNTDPAIGTYVDGTYLAIPSGSNAALVDIARVEVLKGPQGTLFGRNTVGGAVNIVSNAPTGKFEGYLKAELANYDQQTYEGVLNLPIVPDKLDTRFVYQYLDRNDGYGTNLFLGNKTGVINQYYGRGSISFKPDDSWNALLSAYISRSAGNSAGSRLGFVPPGDFIGVFLAGQSREPFLNPSNFQDSITNVIDRFYLKQYGVSGAITGEVAEGVNFKSISSYRYIHYTATTDTDGTPLRLVEVLDFPVLAKQYSQEFHIYGKSFDDRLDWIAGLYYFRMTGSQINHTAFTAAVPLPALISQGSTDSVNTSYAAFAQATYALTDQLRVTGGIRYTHDKRHVDFGDHVELGVNGPFLACLLPNAPEANNAAACSSPSTSKFHYVPFTVGLDYKPADNMLLYAKLSRGYRSGAYNLNALTANPDPVVNAESQRLNTTAVAPEKLVSPEVGLKFDLLDNRLRINGAIFYSRYQNIQISLNQVVKGVAISVLTNTGAAKIWGGELEVEALLGDLRLSGALGVTNPKYDVPPNPQCLPAPACVSGHDYGVGFGRDFINAPKYSVSVGADYPVQLGFGVVTLAANYSWRSKTGFYSHDPVASPFVPASALVTKSYGLLDASATLELASHPVTLMVWGRNLNNARYHPAGFELGSFNYVVNWSGPPRTYGASIKYRF